MSYFFLYHPSNYQWLPAGAPRKDYDLEDYLEDEKKRKKRKRKKQEKELLIILKLIDDLYG